MSEEQLKYYQDYIIPRMPNVDHTPAIEFINNLLSQALGKRDKEVEELKEKAWKYDQLCK